MTSAPKHLPTLDILRGIAALSVCLFHFTGYGLSKVHYEPAARLFSWGWSGVEIFFVISGFIIPYVLMRGNYRLAQFGHFIGKRFVRICPPSYVLLLITMAQCVYLAGHVHPGSYWTIRLSPAAILHNFTYTIPYTPYRWINNVFWTLSVEFCFYLFMGLFFPLIFRNNRFFLATLLVSFAVCSLPFALHIQAMLYLPLFLTGGAALLRYEERIGTGPFLLLLAGLGAWICLRLGWPHAVAGAGTALVIAFVSIRSSVGAFFGKISYSLYLIHTLAGEDLEVLCTKVIPPVTVTGKLLVLSLCVGGTILAAWIFYRLVEAPFIWLSGRLFRSR